MTKEFLFLTFVSEFFLLSGSLQYASKLPGELIMNRTARAMCVTSGRNQMQILVLKRFTPGRQLLTGQPLSLTRTEWIKMDRLVLTGALC